MQRLFSTSTLRRQQELSERYWQFESTASDIQQIFVPSCWENQPGLERYRGTCIYQTTVQLDKGNAQFVFQGVSFFAKVYLDDLLIAEHHNAYTPFTCLVKDISEGAHVLRVEVNNDFSESSALHVPNDYRSFGGITRGVMVESLNEAYIRHMHVIPFQKDGIWLADVKVEIENLSNDVLKAQMKIELAGESCLLDAITVPAMQKMQLSSVISCPNAKTYQLDEPNLYFAKATILINDRPIDDMIDRIGFRTIKVDGEQILFNGEPLLLRGFNRHESHGLFGCAIPLDAMIQDMALLKDLNANAIRTCHYPNDERFLDLCDEQGILVWEESHARGLDVAQITNPHFDAQSADCIESMITNHINHPSLFIWGCLNECPSNNDAGRIVYEKQLSDIKKRDASRPTTTASRYPAQSVFGNKMDKPRPLKAGYHDGDICLDLSDVISFNIYPGWYVDTSTEKMLDRLIEWADAHGAANKPFIISEIGAGAIYGYRSVGNDKWSEERQSQIIQDALDAVFGSKRLSGIFLWQFSDGLVDEEWAMTRPRTMNNKGVVDEYRRPKLSYHTVKSFFGSIAKQKV